MNLSTFYDEYDNLSDERKKAALERIFEFLTRDLAYNENLIKDMLDSFLYLEQDDYFGTEGLDV